MLKLNNNLRKTLEYEKALREMIMEVRLYEKPNEVFKYLTNKLADLYSVNKVVQLHCDDEGNFVVICESSKNKLKKLQEEKIFKAEFFKELFSLIEDSIIVINDIEQIKNIELRNYLNENDIKAFMLYPIQKTDEKYIVMVCSKVSKTWASEDIEALKLIVETILTIYADITKKAELRELEENFIVSLVHDMKSPLFSTQKAIELLTARKPYVRSHDCTKYLSDIYDVNEELLKLVNNLLYASQIDFGKYEIQRECCKINKIINESIKSVKPYAKENKTKIIKNLHKKSVEICGDLSDIKRIFVNLLSNAIIHNPEGIEVTISVDKKDNEILISIKDNGIGIAESEKSKIFHKYHTSQGKVCTGLGLYLSKEIVEHHGGKIWVDSEEGQGSTFYFTLPLYRSTKVINKLIKKDESGMPC